MADKLLELEDGVELWRLEIDEIHEQDVNARVMDMAAFHRLAENIKERGALVESLPYCHVDARGHVTIISGHHRVRAARTAGVRTLHALVDRNALKRSSVVSKQLAHNAIAGHDDAEMLRQLLAEINNVEDLLRSYIDPALLPAPATPLKISSAPALEFDFRMIMFTFLPSQVKDWQLFLDMLPPKQEFIGLAPIDQFELFKEALQRYQKAKEIRSIGTAIGYLVNTALREAQLHADVDPEEKDVWVSIASVLGAAQIPFEAARVIRQALDDMFMDGQISDTARWRAVELWAADWIAGRKPRVDAAD